MKPYYSHAGITIYHGDCREILPTLRVAGDVVVSDPPYNVGYHYTEYHDKMEEDDYWEMLHAVLDPPSVILHYPESVFKYAFSVGMFPEKCVVSNVSTAISHFLSSTYFLAASLVGKLPSFQSK